MFSKHVTKNFSAYCNGELNSEESRRFNEHILSCAKCRAQFEEIRLGVKFAQKLPSLSAPDNLWNNLESRLGTAPTREYVRTGFQSWRFQAAAIAAGLVIAATLGIWWLLRGEAPVAVSPSWEVQRIDGTIRIGHSGVANKGKLRVGEWLGTRIGS